MDDGAEFVGACGLHVGRRKGVLKFSWTKVSWTDRPDTLGEQVSLSFKGEFGFVKVTGPSIHETPSSVYP